MRFEIITYGRSPNISPERISARSELARSDKRNPSERMTPRGRRANWPTSQRHPISDEELNAQVWLDVQLVNFYHQRNGLWPKLRRLFARTIGGRLFPNGGNLSQRDAANRAGRMSRIISGSICGLAVAAVAAFTTTPLFAAASSAGGAKSPHVVLVRGGGGGGGGGHGGGGHGGGGFGGGGGHGFSSGGGRGFSGGFSRSFGGAGRSFSGNARSFGGNSRNFASGNRSFFDRGRAGFDGFDHRGWNRGDWAWRGYGGYGYNGFGWWYPAYYGYGSGSYGYDGSGYTYGDSRPALPQLSAAIEPPPQNNQIAETGQGNRYLDEAIQSFQGGNYQNATRMAKHAIVDLPRNAEAHEVVALAAFANKDYRTAAAEAHAVAALGGVPNWKQVYAIYQNAGIYTLQLRSLEDYVKAHPRSAESQFLLGVQYLTTGYSSEARDHLSKAAELTPNDQIVQDLMKRTAAETRTMVSRPNISATK